jgi:hypothetical protein
MNRAHALEALFELVGSAKDSVKAAKGAKACVITGIYRIGNRVFAVLDGETAVEVKGSEKIVLTSEDFAKYVRPETAALFGGHLQGIDDATIETLLAIFREAAGIVAPDLADVAPPAQVTVPEGWDRNNLRAKFDTAISKKIFEAQKKLLRRVGWNAARRLAVWRGNDGKSYLVTPKKIYDLSNGDPVNEVCGRKIDGGLPRSVKPSEMVRIDAYLDALLAKLG